MTEQQIGLLTVQIIASLFVLAYLGILLLKGREQRQQFNLYAVRDKILYLAASGELSQDSMVFRVFYKAINGGIAEARNLTISSLIHASMKAKDTLELEKRDKLLDAIKRASPEVQSVIIEFFIVMMDIVYSNSLGLRLFVRCAKFLRLLRDGIKTLAPPPKPVAYDTYVYWLDLQSKVSSHINEGAPTYA